MGIASLVAGNFTLRVDEGVPGAENVIRVTWLGRADERHPATVLTPFFAELVREAVQTERSLELRFEDLEHFNSATIAVLVRLIHTLTEREIPIRLTYDGGKRWQKMTFDVIRRFDDSGRLVQVQAV